jgi:hypothetical protein
MMKYIPDVEVASIALIQNTQNHKPGIVDFSTHSHNLAPLHLFATSINWNNLDLFAYCAARSIGCGFEIAGSYYDDDLEPDEESFVGVKIWEITGESIVVSRQAFEGFCLQVLTLTKAIAQAENLSILDKPIWAEILDSQEMLRERLSHDLAN